MKKILLIALSILLVGILAGCSFLDMPNMTEDLPKADIEYLKSIDVKDIESLKLVIPVEKEEKDTWAFGSKNITEKEDQRIIVDLIGEINYKYDENATETKGFDIMIEMKIEDDYYFVFSEDVVVINKDGYRIDEKYKKDVLKLYEEFDYEKEIID